MFKTPARTTFTYPDLPFLFDAFKAREASTPVKKAIAVLNRQNQINAKRAEDAAKRAEEAARHARGPPKNPPRPSPNIPEQGEAKAEEQAEMA